MKYRALLSAAIASVALVAVSILPANADLIDWTLTGVTFADGGTASGSFVLNTTTDTITSFDITTSAGTTILSSQEYDASNSFATANPGGLGGVGGVTFTLDNNSRFFQLYVNGDMTVPGVIDILSGSTNHISYECLACGSLRFVSAGEVSSTPLPAALPLFATGLGGLGLLGWRRRRKAQA
jgi:hypothetical protein